MTIFESLAAARMTLFVHSMGLAKEINMGNPHSHQDGFSLIELMMVAVIVALLATIAIPSLVRSREVAEKGAAIATMKTLHVDQAGYFSHKNRYATLNELNNYAGRTLGTISGTTLLRGNYVYFQFPDDPTLLKTQYQILAVRFRDRIIVSAILMDQDGEIQILVE